MAKPIVPFWQDLTGSDQVLSDTGALTTNKIVATRFADITCEALQGHLLIDQMAKPIEVATLAGQNQQTVLIQKILDRVNLILIWIKRGGGTISPELETAIDNLGIEIQKVDDKVPDKHTNLQP
jgi:hypothetical protein